MNSIAKSASRFVAPVALAIGACGLFTACASLDPLTALPAFADELAPVRTVEGARLRVATVDLTDAHTVVELGLAGGSDRPNQAGHTLGAEDFGSMVTRSHAAVAINGTFFSEDHAKRVMGDMVRDGKVVKYSPWEDGGTTFVMHAGNRPEMYTERAQGAPDRTSHWMSLTGGPRLLRDGKVYLHPREEGFKDPDVFNSATRTALGFTREGSKLLLVSFTSPVSLAKEAQVMKSLGLYQAMNLDGGTSQALATEGRTLIAPGRKLTNILEVYDRRNPAPVSIADHWLAFSESHPEAVLASDGGPKPGDRWIGKLRQGQTLDYAGLHFTTKSGDPVVGVLGGRLSFSEGNFGQIYAAFPKAHRPYALDFEARLLDEHMAMALSPDLSLEVRRAAPAGLYLRKNGVAIARDTHYIADNKWHRYKVVGDEGHLRVQIDGATTPVLDAKADAPSSGLGLSGRGEYRGIKVAEALR